MASKPKIAVNAIVAMDQTRVIGKNGQLPWHLPQDLKHFSKLTKGDSVVMGRKTFDSLPEKYKPLPERLNIVLSRNQHSLGFDEVKVFQDLESLSGFCCNLSNIRGQALWVIGGEQIYRLTAKWWDKVFVTKVAGTHSGDAYFPSFEEDFDLIESVPSEGCSFDIYQRRAS